MQSRSTSIAIAIFLCFVGCGKLSYDKSAPEAKKPVKDVVDYFILLPPRVFHDWQDPVMAEPDMRRAVLTGKVTGYFPLVDIRNGYVSVDQAVEKGYVWPLLEVAFWKGPGADVVGVGIKRSGLKHNPRFFSFSGTEWTEITEEALPDSEQIEFCYLPRFGTAMACNLKGTGAQVQYAWKGDRFQRQ